MFIDLMEKDFDCIVLVSGDTDLIAPLHYLKKRTGKSIIVFNPHERPSEELRAVSTYYKHIPHDLPAKCRWFDNAAKQHPDNGVLHLIAPYGIIRSLSKIKNSSNVESGYHETD